MATVDRSAISTFVGQGAYNARRASALSGVPKSTLHYWARTGFFVPSINPGPRNRLWSWLDLLSLRAIDWLRKNGKAQGAGDSVPRDRIRHLLYVDLPNLGLTPEQLASVPITKLNRHAFFQDAGVWYSATPGNQAVLDQVVSLIAPYQHGPDLLEPRPQLRIVPGKLHGEPHVKDTRLPTATLYALHTTGYSDDQILAWYPELTEEQLAQAIDLETSLQRAA